MNIDEQISHVLTRYSETNDNFYVFDNIPDKKLINALRYYQVPEDASIYALLDTTVFGSAKTGLVITPYGLYWRNDSGFGQELNSLDWVEINQLLPMLSVSKYTLIFKPNVELDVSGSSTMKQGAIIELLNELAPLFNRLIEDVNEDYEMGIVAELMPPTLAVLAMNDGKIDDNLVGQAITVVQSMAHIDHAAIFSALTAQLQHYLAMGQQSMALIQLEQATLLAKWQALNPRQKQVLKNIMQSLQPQSPLAQKWQIQLQAMT